MEEIASASLGGMTDGLGMANLTALLNSDTALPISMR